jgi:hypothetical protein
VIRRVSRQRTLALFLTGLLVLSGCGGPRPASAPTGGADQSPTGASILANPNPVPPGGGLGTTTVTWKTGDGGQGQVYVSQDGGTETLFDAGTDNSKEAPWIQTGSTYEFRVYAGSDHKTQLASVKVTRPQ